MFNFFKKETFKVVACVDGKCINIIDVPDAVFSQKMMGDGFAIIPSSDTIVSPISGEVVTVFPSKHAVGIKRKDIEIIVHIGIDTVALNGEGFTSLVKQGEKVKAGQPIVKLDLPSFEGKNVNLTTMVVFTAGYKENVELACYDQIVKAGDILI